MKRSLKSLLLFSFVALVAVTFFSSCKKTTDTTVKVTVHDASNKIVAGAWVRIFGNSTTTSTSVINDSLLTDAGGQAVFNYNKIYKAGQAGVAVLDIVARKSALYGKNVVKVEAEEQTDVTVFIQ